MNNTIVNIYNSATLFGLLTAIAVGLWVLIWSRHSRTKSSQKNK